MAKLGTDMKLFIQNMVSQRCKMFVKAALEKLNLAYSYLELGEVHLTKAIPSDLKQKLREVLQHSGLVLVEDKTALVIERVKNLIIEMIHYSDELPKMKYSAYISEKIGQDYHTISELFSKNKGITIEHFIILHKIEKVKELIMYDELNLTEISYKLHYSSVSHLSNQFKRITGLTPSFFKNMKKKIRTNLEDL